MRTHLALLLVAGLAAVVAPSTEHPAAASCAGPRLDVDRGVVLRRSSEVTVTGLAFVDGCQDVGHCTETLGCASCRMDDPPPRPFRHVELRLRQRGHSWPLGTTDATGGAGRVSWTFAVPPDVGRGPARLVAGDAQPVPVTIR